MAAPTKNQKIESLAKLVQKRSRGAGLCTPPQRTVLETLMYAALLENTTFDKADIAYTVLENYYIDWNEIRVCSNRELADTLTNLPDPEAAAERVRKALQGIFEKTYAFDLEDLRKKGKPLAEHIKFLESISAGTPYMIQYAAQVALDGHLIPLDEASLRVMRRLGLMQVSSVGNQEVCIGIERVILKKSGVTFAAQLHHFAAGYYDVPDSPELLKQLSAIDAEAVNRSWDSPTLTNVTESLPACTCEAVPEISASKPKKSKEATQKTSTKSAKSAKSTPKPDEPAEKKSPRKTEKQAEKKVAVDKPVAKTRQKQTKPAKSAKPAKVVAVSQKTPAKTPTKATQSKKMLPKEQATPSKPKKKSETVNKKETAKPVKKNKVASPTKALRKKKPK